MEPSEGALRHFAVVARFPCLNGKRCAEEHVGDEPSAVVPRQADGTNRVSVGSCEENGKATGLGVGHVLVHLLKHLRSEVCGRHPC